MGQLLGTIDAVDDETIAAAVTALAHDAPRRRQMRKVALSLIDGEGAARIAADLAQVLREETAPSKASR
jgi:hypothetical protein